MNRLFFTLIQISVFLCVSYGGFAENAGSSCAKAIKDVSNKSTIASASIWANMRNSPGSISFESNDIFHAAKERISTLKAPPNFCPKGCVMREQAVLFFRSFPHKVRSDYDEEKRCGDMEQSTLMEPIHYETLELRSIDDLNNWIADISQGDGKNGKDLYLRCDGSCSPRYEYTIEKIQEDPSKYLVQATIICGQARDKDDNQYNLDSFFRWSCEPKK